MIKVEIIEPSRGQPIKTIYFSDSSGGCFRSAHYDKNGVPILENLKEIHLDKSTLQSVSLLAGVDYKLVAFRKYLWDPHNKPIATEDYKLVNGEFMMINKSIYEDYDPSTLISWKNTWYDANNNPCYMWVKEKEKYKFCTLDGQEVESFGAYMAENFKDFETIEDIEQQILKLAVERLLSE